MSALGVVGSAGWLIVAFWWGWWARGWYHRLGFSVHTIYLKPGQVVSISNMETPPDVPV